jgi:Zn-dependent peptidase ImmA (M78 family)
MSPRVTINPTLYKWAVDRARKDPIKNFPNYPLWLTGEKKPTLKQLEEFAKFVRIPVGYLFLDNPPKEELPLPDMRTIRKTSKPSPNLLDTIRIYEDRQEWYKDFAMRDNAEELSFVGKFKVTDSPSVAADFLRNLLEIDRLPNDYKEAKKCLRNRIQSLGVLVMLSGIVGNNTHRTLNVEEFRGFSISDNIAPLIFVNTKDAPRAQIFTLLHEFSHILLGESAISDTKFEAKDQPLQEKWCNLVAGQALIPDNALAGFDIKSLDEKLLNGMSKEYCVSTQVVLFRLYECGYLSEAEFFEKLKREKERSFALAENKSPSGGGGDFYNNLMHTLGASFVEAVVIAAKNEWTTYRDAYNLLGAKNNKVFDNLAERAGMA